MKEKLEKIVRSGKKILAGAGLVSLLSSSVYSCGSEEDNYNGTQTIQCYSNYDCKENQVCIGGVCQSPEENLPETNQDNDSDGLKAIVYGGSDCDDNNSKINPKRLDLCDGLDNNCNDIIDEWGCGEYIYTTLYLDQGIYSFDLQTGTKKLIFTAGEDSGAFFDVSLNRQKIAFSKNPNSDYYKILYVMNMDGSNLQELSADDPFIGDMGWINNQTIVTGVLCFPCGYDNNKIEFKIYSFNLNGGTTILRPDIAKQDYVIDTNDGRILGIEVADYSSGDERRLFVYDFNTGSTQYLSQDYSLSAAAFFSKKNNDVLFIEKANNESCPAIYSYNINSNSATKITDLDTKVCNTTYTPAFSRGILEHPSGKERLSYYLSEQLGSKDTGFCSIFTDGTGEACDKSDDFIMVPAKLIHLP